MVSVVGIVTDGKRVLLLKKKHPDWQKGSYNGVGGEVGFDSTPFETIVKKCEEDTGLKIKVWEELESTISPRGNELIFFLAIIEKDELKKAQTLSDERVELFKIKKLPNTILKDVKIQIEKRFLEEEKKRDKIKQILLYILLSVIFILLCLIIVGKARNGDFLYYLKEEEKHNVIEEDMNKKMQFQKGFNQKTNFGKE